MRTFLLEVRHWHTGGRAHVIRTMNLSEINPALREQEAELATYYLKQILDRSGYVLWQEIPSDPQSRSPYVHFAHPAGSVVIAPVEGEEGRVWQFTPETLGSLRALYAASEDMPIVEGLVVPSYIAPYFKIRDVIRAWQPALLSYTGLLENWQWIALVVLVALGMIVAWAITWLILRLWFGKRPITRLDRHFKSSFLWPGGYGLLHPAAGWMERTGRHPIYCLAH
jgi:hypothetical protein